ncbi:MAG TPA: hypothetical protein VGG49_09975 [Steroidobacteraceae bacterium]
MAVPRQNAESRAQAALDTLNALDPVAPRPEQIATVRKGLADGHFLVVARAAMLAGERLLPELIAALLAAYTRFLLNPVKRDPGCKAKQTIARALVRLQCQDISFYRAGIHYRQLEPVWGGRADTATDVRCSCAMGLAASGSLRAIAELTGLLNDPEPVVRSGAARAISCGNPYEAEAVLRLKVKIGDVEPEVIGECFSALLAIQPEYSLPFVADYLRGKDPALQEYAALALGESRQAEGLQMLREAWDDVVDAEGRGALIRAAALHRSEPAFAWLLSIIGTGTPKLAIAAANALEIYERNSQLVERVNAAKARRKDQL